MNLPPVLRQRYLDANGNPLAGGKLYSYQALTVTPQATYTDSSGGTANANPVVLDANGECSLWLDPALSYKFVLKDSTDVVQWTVDGVVGILGAGAVVAASMAYSSIDGQTAKTTMLSADEILIADTAASALKKMTRANFLPTPTVQRFLSSSGTYTTPTSPAPRFIKIKMVGGGGGSSGTGSSGAGNGGAGGNTTFGSSLLTATGGAGGVWLNSAGAGGTATVSSPAVALVALAGGIGQSANAVGTSGAYGLGGMGASSPFGGAGAGGGATNLTGTAAAANTGSGGGGNGIVVANGIAGCGGSAGGYVEAMISAPSATYSYAVGAAGAAGTAGVGGVVGYAGGSGIIVVEEYYQ